MPKAKGLPRRAETMGEKALGMVLATAAQLRSGTGLTEDQAKRGMQDLRERGFVRSEAFGCLLPKASHFFLTPEGLDYFGASEEQRSWHGLDAIGNLLIYDILRVEAVNEIATLCIPGGWELAGVQWFEGQQPMAAAAAYRHPGHSSLAYRVFCLPSLMDNQWELCLRFEELRESLQAQAVDPKKNFRPAELCIVAADQWGAARSVTLASALLFGWLYPGDIKAWYYGGGGWRVSDGASAITGSTPAEIDPFDAPTGSLRATASVRKLGPRRFGHILKDRIWSTGRGQKLFHVMTRLCEYPVISAPHLAALSGEARRGRETRSRLDELVELGMAEVVASEVRTNPRLSISRRGRGGPRYGPAQAGRSLMWYTWRCRPSGLYTRSEHSLAGKEQWSFRHQDLAYEILAQFREEGRPVAPGWRAHARLANGNTIEPDGMVCIRSRRRGAWCFLEVELSDTGVKAFKARCEKYGSGGRLESHPLMMVLRNGRAEANFHRAVAQFAPRLRVVTTNLPRLRAGGVMGAEVWQIPEV